MKTIIKDVSGAKLLPMTVSAYPVVYVCHLLLKTQHCHLCQNGRYNLPSGARPPQPPTATPITRPLQLLPPAHPLHLPLMILQTVAVNPTVLAS